MTEQEIKDRLSELYAKQAAATGWGAAVGARHEEIKSLEGQLAALRRPSTDTAEAELKSVRQQIVNFVDSGAQDSEPIKVTNGDLCRWFDRLEIVSALLRAPAQAETDPFNRKQVEAICRAVCVVEGIDPDDTEWTGDDPPWTRYADAVAGALLAPAYNAPEQEELAGIIRSGISLGKPAFEIAGRVLAAITVSSTGGNTP